MKKRKSRAGVAIFLKSEHGQGMVEYTIIIAGIAVVVAIAIFLLGPQFADMFNNLQAAFENNSNVTLP